MQGESNPWDRRPDEDQKDFEAFCEYMLMDPRPSGAQFAELTNGKYGQKRVNERRMSKFQWRERRAARDERDAKLLLAARTDAKLDAQREITLIEFREGMISESSKLLDAATKLMQKSMAAAETLEIETMTGSHISQMARASKDLAVAAVELRAAALGVSDITDSIARLSQNIETSDTTESAHG